MLYPVGFRRDATARLKIEANQDFGSLTVRIRKGRSKGWEREIQKDSRAGAERSFSLTSSREIMSAVVESAMGGRPPIFAQRQRVVGATRVARNACVERSWMPAGGKRAREEADIETAKFWERTDRMWDMLQNEVQKAVAKRRAAHEANMAESRRVASLHPLKKKSEIEAGETEEMPPTADELMTPDMAPAESDIKVQTMCKSRAGMLAASQTPALCPAKVGSPVMTETALSFSRSLTFKQPSGADRNLTKAFTADPEDITLFSLYN